MNKLLEIELNEQLDFKRIDRLRKVMENREASIDSFRALAYTNSFKKSEGEPYIIRKAKAFALTLETMPIYIQEDSLIFGNQASRNFAAPIFPEYSIDWVIDELDEFEKRDGDVFKISEEDKKVLKDIQPYWSGHTHEDSVNSDLSENIKISEKQHVIHRGGISMSGDGHIVIDHECLLKKGLIPIINEAKDKLTTNLSEKQRAFYQAVIISLEASLKWVKRYGVLAKEEAINAKGQRKQELLEMSTMCQHLLEGKAKSFYEAVESVYLLHILQMIESNGHSFCYGRFDQYTYELYKNDLNQKVITQAQALEIITHMFIMNSSLNKVRPIGHTRFSQGYPLYSNLVVGGYKPNGEDGSNDLSYLCIEAMHLTSLAEPNFSMRYNLHSPKKLTRLAAKLIRTGCGMPSMFNDEVAIKGLIDLGIEKADAYDYCPIGCVETGVPGKYGHRATGMTYVNWGKLVEMLMFNGYDPKSNIQLVSIDGSANNYIDYQSFGEVKRAWEKLLKRYSDIAVECDKICDKHLEKYDADPLASSLIDNSMRLGKTLKSGGCKYDVISQSNIGPSVVGNSLMVIKELIFEKKELTFKMLREAMLDNYQSKANKIIQAKCLKVHKFGNDFDDVDEMVKYVFNTYLDLLPTYQTLRSHLGPEVSCYSMSTSNITSYVPNGLDVGATPDGRQDKAPLNEGCSPTESSDTNGPTAVLNSVSKLPNEKVAAGQLLNMRFAPSALSGEVNLNRFINLLEASVSLGIYHNQFNVLDTKTLRDAQVHPENYRNLIVRVAGYCAQFISLMPEAQEAIIARTENVFN